MVTRRTALITGVAGQDGSYLAEQLLASDYRVCGIARSLAPEACARIAHLLDRLELVEGDVAEQSVVDVAVRSWCPDEIYHLAGDSFAAGWEADGTLVARAASASAHVLGAVARYCPRGRVVLASSSEAFGAPRAAPQNEETPMAAVTSYGQAKAALWMSARRAREQGLLVSCAILYNHESPRRSSRFVARKITRAAAAVAAGLQAELVLGNLDARRDWGAAVEYADAMWRMAQADDPSDFVIGSGRSRTVRDLCDIAFAAVGREAGRYVRSDPALFRLVDATTLVADPSRASTLLGWSARRTLEEIVTEMVAADVARLAGAAA